MRVPAIEQCSEPISLNHNRFQNSRSVHADHTIEDSDYGGANAPGMTGHSPSSSAARDTPRSRRRRIGVRLRPALPDLNSTT